MQLHVTSCVVKIEWYHFVGSHSMMRKKIVKAYVYTRIVVGAMYTSHRKKHQLIYVNKSLFFPSMEMSNCSEGNKWNDRNWNKLQ